MINLFFVYIFASDMYLKVPGKRGVFFAALFLEFIWFIVATHLLRLVLKRIQWIRMPVKKVIMLFIAAVCVTGLISYYGARLTAILTNSSIVEFEKKENLQKAINKEKTMNMAGTDYYIPGKIFLSDSIGYKAFVNIKKSTGWSRNFWQPAVAKSMRLLCGYHLRHPPPESYGHS